MNQSQRLLKNVFAGGVGNIVGGGLQFVAVLFLARKLGVSEFGAYSVLATMSFVLNRFADLGTSAILVRDLAVAPARTKELVSSALSLAWILTVFISAGIAAGVHFIPSLSRLQAATLLMAISGLLQFPCACYGAVMRAREDNELEVLGFVLHKIALLVGLWFAIRMGVELRGVAIAYLLCASLQLWFCRWIVIRRYVRPHWRFDFATWKYLLTQSAPFGIAAAARLVAEQGDLTILAWILGMSAVGLYSAVYRITIGFRFVPQAMVIGLFPIYSRAASRFHASDSNHSEFERLYDLGIRAFIFMGLPFAVIVLFASEPLISFLLGPAYLDAASAFRILAIAAGIAFAGSPFPYLLTALNEQRFLLVSSIASSVFRMALVLGLTWRLGILGTSWAVLISEGALLCLWIAYLASKHFNLEIRAMVLKATVAAAGMAALLHCRSSGALLPVMISIGIAGALYSLLIYKLEVFSADELQLAAEGMSFVKPFLAEWTHRIRLR